MLESNKYANILGINFECHSDPRPSTCPMEVGQQPYLDETTGEYQCPLCLYVLNTQSAEDENPHGEDIIDEEEASSLGLVYVAETDKIQVDQTDEEKRVVDRKRDISNIISLIISVDRPYTDYLANNVEEVITMLTELEEAEVDGFELRKNIRPKILAVTSHLFKRLPNSKALEILGEKSGSILRRKLFLDKTYTTKIDNTISMAINEVGQSLEIPNATISQAIDMFEKDLPANREPKDRVKGAAWLYVYLTKKTDIPIKRNQFTSLSGVSRISFGKSVSVYSSYF